MQLHETLQIVPGLPFVSVDCGGGGDILTGLDVISDKILHEPVVRLFCLQQSGLGRPGLRIVFGLGAAGDRNALAFDHQLGKPGSGLEPAGSGHADLCLILQLLFPAPITEHGILRDVSPAEFTSHKILLPRLRPGLFSGKGKIKNMRCGQ